MTQRTKAFTLVEIMIVVAIIAIIASIPTVLYMQHVKRAMASEAVATMALIRENIRDHFITDHAFFDVTSGHLADAPPAGAGVEVGVAQFFSSAAFSVDGTAPASPRFQNPGPVDFIITADGSASVPCGASGTDCATEAGSVSKLRLEMDNTGRIFISYDNGTNWKKF
ncbi:MAG: prepilin-type N-terminal cleavage/methylation domain-containing protein [Candidatus Omnitrophica bacterium]|nr:prepilin-type N-terminal cleavage/methylation domain-containing protein [Candidatus Omnitrophota bacterium]